MDEIQVNPHSFEEYKESVLKVIEHRLKQFYSDISGLEIGQIEADQASLNAHPYLESLQGIQSNQINILDETLIDVTFAEQSILDGNFFWEHAAAGEATRLGIGTKYIIDLSTFTLERIKNMIIEEIKKDLEKANDPQINDKLNEASVSFSEQNLHDMCGGNPTNLMPLTLGIRHMLQMVFDVRRVAQKYGKDPEETVKKQKTLLILNETTNQQIIDEIRKYNFFGLTPENVFFMVQKPFNGITLQDGRLFFAEGKDNLRLHNHGQMMMQKAHNNSIFRLVEGHPQYLGENEFEAVLASCSDMLSYNIEDIDYLSKAIDLHSLALSLNLGKNGYDMVMEIVAQNPFRPQKGGAAFYDPVAKKNVMVESNRLGNMKNEDIKHLNRNFNHYPNPVNSFRKMKHCGLHLPFEVKTAHDGVKYIYPNPVQGDMNLLVKTAFVMRKELKPINNWKSAATTPPAIKAFVEQENQPGFKEFAESVLRA